MGSIFSDISIRVGELLCPFRICRGYRWSTTSHVSDSGADRQRLDAAHGAAPPRRSRSIARPLSSAAKEFADRLGDDGVRQDDRHVERGEGIAVSLGKADAVERDCLGAFRLKPFPGREYRLRPVAVRADGGELRGRARPARRGMIFGAAFNHT